MVKAALAGMLALVVIGSTPVAADPANSQIAQVKSMLRLTPAQERHWPPVEAALRNLARQATAREDDSDGMVQRFRAKAKSLAVNTAAIQRVVAAARPLIRILDEEQKQTARALVGSYGATSLASAL
jgi:LTXXQ motif family protein